MDDILQGHLSACHFRQRRRYHRSNRLVRGFSHQPLLTPSNCIRTPMTWVVVKRFGVQRSLRGTHPRRALDWAEAIVLYYPCESMRAIRPGVSTLDPSETTIHHIMCHKCDMIIIFAFQSLHANYSYPVHGIHGRCMLASNLVYSAVSGECRAQHLFYNDSPTDREKRPRLRS